MRINILVNAPWGTTAYSNMARWYGPRLRTAGHDVSMTALWGLQGGVIEWEGISVYPKGIDLYTKDVQAAHAHHWNADVFFSWCDAFVVEPDRLRVPWAPWFPIDSDKLSPHLIPLIEKARWPLVYSQWGHDVAIDHGLEHVRYMPIGIDTDAYTIKDKREAREALGLPQDRYIVGMVQANINGDRKAIPQQMAAFRRFLDHEPDALLYMHTNKTDAIKGVDLQAICNSLGLVPGQNVIFAHQHSYLTGLYGDESMTNIYNSLDLLLSVTRAEGFGIPIIEAAACGVPAVVGRWSSMTELDFCNLGVSESDTVRMWNNFDTWWWLPKEEAIADALRFAHSQTFDDRWEIRRQALAYDADRIWRDHWLPILAEMGEECGERTSSPVRNQAEPA